MYSIAGLENLRNLAQPSEEVLKKVLHGIVARDYEKVTAHLAESFGLSSSQGQS
ncbi:MAG: hypothetical protein U0X76_12360 [Bacteroidia bacterium]